jgi:hypothetical protein
VVRAGRETVDRLRVYVVDVPLGALSLDAARLPHGASWNDCAPNDFTLHVRYLDDDLELCRHPLDLAVQACSEKGSPLRALLEQAVNRADTLRERAGSTPAATAHRNRGPCEFEMLHAYLMLWCLKITDLRFQQPATCR